MTKNDFMQRVVISLCTNESFLKAHPKRHYWTFAEDLWNAQPKQEKKEAEKTERFIPPTATMVDDYVIKSGGGGLFTGEQFVNFYESKGWMIGKNKMKSWQSAVNTWLVKAREKRQATTTNNYKL